MSTRKLCVGAIVRFPREKAKHAQRVSEYRIEQLLKIEDGATLYRIKSVSEPFYRVVAETDLITRY